MDGVTGARGPSARLAVEVVKRAGIDSVTVHCLSMVASLAWATAQKPCNAINIPVLVRLINRITERETKTDILRRN